MLNTTCSHSIHSKGLASISISTGAAAASPAVLRIEQRGTRPLAPEAVQAAASWPLPPAVAVVVDGSSEVVYVTSERLPVTAGVTGVSSWVSVIDTAAE